MKYEIQIKEHHLDTFGHVNNATYLQIYEEARWELITQRGYGMDVVMQSKQGPVLLDLSMKFFKEIKLRETISITFELLKYEGKVGQFRQRMLNHNGEVMNEFMMTFGLFDLKTRKLIEPTEAWKKAIGLN